MEMNLGCSLACLLKRTDDGGLDDLMSIVKSGGGCEYAEIEDLLNNRLDVGGVENGTVNVTDLVKQMEKERDNSLDVVEEEKNLNREKYQNRLEFHNKWRDFN